MLIPGGNNKKQCTMVHVIAYEKHPYTSNKHDDDDDGGDDDDVDSVVRWQNINLEKATKERKNK